MSPTARYVPCIPWGKGVEISGAKNEPHSVMNVTATIAYFPGVAPPEQSAGQALGIAESEMQVKPVPRPRLFPVITKRKTRGIRWSEYPVTRRLT